MSKTIFIIIVSVLFSFLASIELNTRYREAHQDYEKNPEKFDHQEPASGFSAIDGACVAFIVTLICLVATLFKALGVVILAICYVVIFNHQSNVRDGIYRSKALFWLVMPFTITSMAYCLPRLCDLIGCKDFVLALLISWGIPIAALIALAAAGSHREKSTKGGD